MLKGQTSAFFFFFFYSRPRFANNLSCAAGLHLSQFVLFLMKLKVILLIIAPLRKVNVFSISHNNNIFVNINLNYAIISNEVEGKQFFFLSFSLALLQAPPLISKRNN